MQRCFKPEDFSEMVYQLAFINFLMLLNLAMGSETAQDSEEGKQNSFLLAVTKSNSCTEEVCLHSQVWDNYTTLLPVMMVS